MKRALIVRVIKKDGTSYGGFKNSTTSGDIITAPDWNPNKECGHGIHGWLWGMGREGKEHAGDKIWQVCEVDLDTGINLDGKWKFPSVKVVYSGNQAEAMKLTLDGNIAHVKERAFATTSGNNSSAATSGKSSPAVCCGIDCKAKSGPYGYILLGYMDQEIVKFKGASVGCGDGSDGLLKADTWYHIYNKEICEFVDN